ncbi:MAG: type I-F CRISPR-associated protein Csy3 [Reinekea sp.]|jgi:CRISPR-associated protein Csy3
MSIKTAAVLAFERKLSNSDAIMSAGNWAEKETSSWLPIKVTEKAIRGTISNRQKNAIMNDHAKLDNEIKKANLQRVDVAALPFDADSLKLEFTLRVLGNVSMPSVCDNQEYQQALQETVNGYINETGFDKLALRYAANIANGRFLWRNRVGAEAVNVIVTQLELENSTSWTFNAHDFSLRDFNHRTDELNALADAIKQGLQGDGYSFFKIEAYAKLGAGQEVFPSQELELDSANSKRGRKSKVLYKLTDDVAAMHSQKIGNALRTIDDWYGNANVSAEEYGPISVEPFGSVTNRGRAFRNNKNDFYTLFDKWVTKGQAPELNQQHYVIATLIRGGVFGEKSE